MNRLYLVLGAVAVIGIIAVVVSVGGSALGNTATRPVDLGPIDEVALVEMARGVEKGNPESQVWVLEFADFQCPACMAFAQGVKPLLELNYINEGKVRFVYYDFPLTNIHPNAFLAARAGRCAEEQGRFWEFHDELYRSQPVWAGSGNPAGEFLTYAGNVGADRRAFESCLRSERHAELVTANMELGIRLGVPGTPTVMIRQGSGMATRVGSDYASIARAIDEALEAGAAR